MKKHRIRMLSSVMIILTLLFSMVAVPSVSAANYDLSESQIQKIENDYHKHGYVLKQNFWANNTASGKTAIKGVQKLLCAAGYTVTVDGGYGPKTAEAVKKFQKAYGLTVDGKVGKNTINKLLAVVRSKNTAPVRDLKISAPASVYLESGQTTTVTVTFSGIGIDKVDVALSGKGLSARLVSCQWKAYPSSCSANLELSADSSFNGGSFTFQLKNNEYGVVKQQKVPVDYENIGKAALDLAKKDIGKSGASLGYNEPWCAHYVSKVLKGAGLDIKDCSTPRQVVQEVLTNQQGNYYSFRSANVTSLQNHGLKSLDQVYETSRNEFVPEPGDIIIFRWNSEPQDINWSHIGIVKSFDGKNNRITTIEGNTSGGKVDEKERAFDKTVVGILRLD